MATGLAWRLHALAPGFASRPFGRFALYIFLCAGSPHGFSEVIQSCGRRTETWGQPFSRNFLPFRFAPMRCLSAAPAPMHFGTALPVRPPATTQTPASWHGTETESALQTFPVSLCVGALCGISLLPAKDRLCLTKCPLGSKGLRKAYLLQQVLHHLEKLHQAPDLPSSPRQGWQIQPERIRSSKSSTHTRTVRYSFPQTRSCTLSLTPLLIYLQYSTGRLQDWLHFAKTRSNVNG